MSVAVITGAASGIGAGLAREAVRRGMDVVLADLDAAALEAVATEIGGKTIAQACDVTNLKDMQLLAEETFRVFGRVDLLFNNAGILRTGLTWDIDPEDWNKVLNVNIMGIVNSLHAFVPKMLATDISRVPALPVHGTLFRDQVRRCRADGSACWRTQGERLENQCVLAGAGAGEVPYIRGQAARVIARIPCRHDGHAGYQWPDSRRILATRIRRH